MYLITKLISNSTLNKIKHQKTNWDFSTPKNLQKQASLIFENRPLNYNRQI